MNRMSRRKFLKRGALTLGSALGGPLIVPPSVLGSAGEVAPSNVITLGAIGLGNRGLHVLGNLLEQRDVRCLAVSDCWADRRHRGKAMVDGRTGTGDCKAYRFHEELLGRADVDAVIVATGDRWHSVLSMLAARAGKDVYCEKPFSLTISEGRALVETTRRYGTVWQCGTQRRSNNAYRFVVECVRSGRIGRLETITTSFGSWGGNGFARPEPEPDPDRFDYDRWLGQAPWAPYSSVRVGLWRNHWDTGAGSVADMGPHYFDVAQWARDSERSGPIDYEGEGEFFEEGFTQVPYRVNIRARYADGVRLRMDNDPKGVRFEGDEGWIHITDAGVITANPESILGARRIPREDWSRIVPHIRDFIRCIRSRRLTVSHPETAHRSHTIAHCANIALRLGRKVRWNPEAERFVNDEEANRMISRAMRAPWRA